ncbi:class I SAM-dependent DNA methyltransferase [Jannaschia formosa]|uniref:class I SAM-dependent DNA methyltransferase n=1 Tax=Jannaschia formosa TaxID=2259592 RepID=UPI000E1C0EE5|nr:methyltransferase domain-containing protein [Jannaschia formosa]TFL18283.1 methyltransferase domain-containing protein [Jannaschia formosa]
MSGFSRDLWSPRPAEENRALYADWAEGYDADLVEAGYATPDRVARALADHLPDRAAPVMDFGCGTGLSGEALARAGFTTIDGTDITTEMLAKARGKGVYRDLTVGTPGEAGDLTAHAAVVATGVISLGAAPAATLPMLLDAMAPGALLVFSFNDSTLADRDYLLTLAEAQLAGSTLIWAQHGPHLPGHEGARGATVHVLRRA